MSINRLLTSTVIIRLQYSIDNLLPIFTRKTNETMKAKPGSPDTYADKIDRFLYKLRCADDDIKELENKLAIARATRETAIKALDLLEKCCYVSPEAPYTKLDEREISDLVRKKLNDMNDQLRLETEQYY